MLTVLGALLPFAVMLLLLGLPALVLWRRRGAPRRLPPGRVPAVTARTSAAGLAPVSTRLLVHEVDDAGQHVGVGVGRHAVARG